MDAAMTLRLAWRGWAHACAKQRAIGAHAEAMWRDRTRRTKAKVFIAWAHSVKFAIKRRELLCDRAKVRVANARLTAATRAWKARVRFQRTQRRDVIRAYLIMRAKKFLRAWLDVAIEGRATRPVKVTTEETKTPTTPTRAVSESGSSSAVRRYRRETRTAMSVDDMKSRLWTHANAPSSPVVKVIESNSSDATDEDEDERSVDTTISASTSTTTTTTMTTKTTSGGAQVPGATVPGELPTAPKQKAVVRRRKIVAKQAGTSTTEAEADATAVAAPRAPIAVTTATASAPSTTPSTPSVVEVIPTSMTTSSRESPSTTTSLSMVVVFLILGVALVGSVTILGMIFGFSLSTDGSSIAALNEAQRNVTILARASAAQRRELEACRTFGGGVPDASQNAAIASAEAKVSDSVVRISELEVKLSAAQAEKASAQSAQKLAEGRLHKLGSLAMDKLQIAEALDKMTTRATYCETVSSQAMKLSKARDVCIARADTCDKLALTLKLQVSEYSSGLQSAQKSLQETVEVANACRYQIGLPAYSPKHKSRLGTFASSAFSSIPGLSDLFSYTAIAFYLVVGYAYYLKIMVSELVVERDTLVTHLAKLNVEGVPSKVDNSASTSAAAQVAAARASSKRARSLDDLITSQEDSSERKKTAAERASEIIIEEEDETVAVPVTSENIETHAAVTSGAVEETKKEDDEQSERSIRLVEKWVEKSQDEEIKDELERIRRLVALEDEREKAAEKAQLDALKEKAQDS
uniref:Uncharacterized protein n=1 Tax=Ostreococcus mediterraneus TaxID=1486918 RepID=A0A7S0PP50_9CHLO